MKANSKLASEAMPVVAESARLCVTQVLVEPVQVWFHCPRCQVELAGFLSDPRGVCGVVCQDCGEEFDISSKAKLVIV